MATTDSIKFKAKSWIDVFGGRASKAVGSLVTNAFKKPVAGLMFYGALISLGIASVHLLIAALLGSAFERLLASGHIVGMEGAHADRRDSGVTCVCVRAREALTCMGACAAACNKWQSTRVRSRRCALLPTRRIWTTRTCRHSEAPNERRSADATHNRAAHHTAPDLMWPLQRAP